MSIVPANHRRERMATLPCSSGWMREAPRVPCWVPSPSPTVPARNAADVRPLPASVTITRDLAALRAAVHRRRYDMVHATVTVAERGIRRTPGPTHACSSMRGLVRQSPAIRVPNRFRRHITAGRAPRLGRAARRERDWLSV